MHTNFVTHRGSEKEPFFETNTAAHTGINTGTKTTLTVNQFPQSYGESPEEYRFTATDSCFFVSKFALPLAEVDGVESPQTQGMPYTLMNLDSYIKERMKSTDYDGRRFRYKEKFIEFKEVAGVVKEFFKELFLKYDFAIRFKSKDIDSIKAEGFKNVFQTKSRDEDYLNKRRNFGSECFGIANYSKINTADLERYGFLCDAKAPLDTADGANSYGDYRAIINKEKVFNVTTFTLGDSLNHKDEAVLSRVSDPEICSIPGVVVGDPSLLLRLYSSIADGELSVDSGPHKVCESLK